MSNVDSREIERQKPSRTGAWIAGGLLLGILVGVLFGEYCGALGVVGYAYVGLLQMTVLPYLMISLVAKMGRLDLQQAKKIGFAALIVLFVFWLIGIALIVAVSEFLPPVQGASFYSPTSMLDLLDVASAALGQINSFLVRLAPLGLFSLTAAAAGTLRIEELARLKAYLIVLALACLIAAFGILPLFVSWFTEIRYGQVLRAAQEPLLTAVATGRLFVVLP